MKTSHQFIISGLFLFAIGLFFGITGTFQYVVPGFLKSFLSFEKVRPMHVSAVVFWIIITAVGCVLHYLQEHLGRQLRFPILAKIQFWLFVSVIPLIFISYLFGFFGGREYWEFHPILALPIIIGWILLLVNFIASLKSLKNQPVYIWMWLTGIVFFLFTFLESYLWLIPYFRSNIIADMTIQWKSYGSMVGSWNMLIYGSSIYLMDKISGDKKYSYSKIGYLIYSLGLFNLMFNWGHHIYSLPTHSYVKYISYSVSMTELLLLGRIIYLWKSSLDTAKKYLHKTSYCFLIAADFWVFVMLFQAILMSIPAINLYTHGTHITVAHTMGTTIGINSMLLFAFVYDILGKQQLQKTNAKLFNYGYFIANISLFVFCIALVIAGIIRSKWQMSENQEAFGTMMQQMLPFLVLFCISGIVLALGFLMLLKHLLYDIKSKKNI